MRSQSQTGQLARMGFQATKQAAQWLENWSLPPGDEQRVLQYAQQSCDPDLALEGLFRVAEVRPGLVEQLAGAEEWGNRLASVLAASAALTQHLVNRPEQADLVAADPVRRTAAQLREVLLAAVGADADAAEPVGEKTRGDDLRIAYRGELLRIAARDLTCDDPVAQLDEVAAELADLADATVEAALAIARDDVGPEATHVRLGIIALGKCGAQELNYVSDVDVLFVGEPVLVDGEPMVSSQQAIAIATRLASSVTRICSAHTAAGTIWQLDAALRPEGKAGPLVRTLDSHRAYYDKWAKNWEFQAMLKARPMAGDLALAAEFCKIVDPKVWSVAGREHFVQDVQAMRKRVIAHIPSKERGREIKLGEGGLRDVEFSVQLLQLVHGRADERLRTRSTLPGLAALVDHGYVGRKEGAELDEAYRFERVLEHRAQLFRLRRTHLLPDRPEEARRIGRSLKRGEMNVIDEFRKRSRRVLALHKRLFYSPVLEAVARISTGEVRLTTDAALERMSALGFLDPKAALRHIDALTQGLTRQTEIQRQLLPAMLGWLAEGPAPDAGLLAFRQVSESLGSTSWYLRALRDEGAMAERLARLLSSSPYLVELLKRNPQSMQLLGDTSQLQPRTPAQLLREMTAVAELHTQPTDAMDAIRGVRRRELFRLGVGDLLEEIDVETVGRAVSDLTSATLDAALAVVARDRPGPQLAILAMGRWGGEELSYSSDADAMFVIAEEGTEAIESATRMVADLRKLLSRPGPEPKLDVDADLRPEGKGGPMVRSVAGYRAYYDRWSSTWEAQALVRAAHGAGNTEVTGELLALIDGLRWPENGLTGKQLIEIRRLKARMEAERLPRGKDRRRHLKLGPGGLSDVEWTVQVLQLQHAGKIPALRTPRTLEALQALVDADLVTAEDAAGLREAWLLASQIRNRTMLASGKPSDSLPSDSRDLAQVAELMGYNKGEASHLDAQWLRVARQARQIVERLFWDEA